MVRFYQLSALLLLVSWHANAQPSPADNIKTTKGILYFAIGTQRIFYGLSDIRLRGQTNHSFDFILFHVKGKDEGGFKWDTAPQFSYTVGYYFRNKKFGLEYQYDHIKYFVTQNQKVHVKGTIDDHLYDKDTVLTKDFVQLEHSDGANYAMLNFVKWFPLNVFKKQKLVLDVLAKGGAGIVNPKTNSTVMGNHRDDHYHVSGYVVGVEGGLRLNFLNYVFVTGTLKETFADYNDFLIAGGKGSQKWFATQFNYLVGAQFPL